MTTKVAQNHILKLLEDDLKIQKKKLKKIENRVDPTMEFLDLVKRGHEIIEAIQAGENYLSYKAELERLSGKEKRLRKKMDKYDVGKDIQNEIDQRMLVSDLENEFFMMKLRFNK